jgi:TonB family protein
MDALEGGESIHPDELSNDLKNLQQRLNERIGKKTKVVPMWVWPARIAAGLAFLVISTFIIIQLRQNSSRQEQLAQTEEAKPKPSEPAAAGPVATDSPATSSPTNSDEFFALKQTEEKPKFVSPKSLARENQAETSTYSYATTEQSVNQEPLPAIADQPVVSKAEPSLDSLLQGRVAGVEVQQQNNAPAVEQRDDIRSNGFIAGETEKKKESTLPLARTAKPYRIISGNVTTEDGVGLPGVNVMIKGSSTGTVSDAGGNYQLKVDDQNPSLTFSFIGMESKEVEAGDASELNVQMDPDISQLSEVVVVGYGAQPKDSAEYTTLEFATPYGGRTAYKQYLEKNLSYPQQALANKVEGRVTVQFTIQPTGQLTDFKVLKGLGFGCEEEVIRLIKQGPKWNPTRRDTQPITDKVKVRMRFRMPKK